MRTHQVSLVDIVEAWARGHQLPGKRPPAPRQEATSYQTRGHQHPGKRPPALRSGPKVCSFLAHLMPIFFKSSSVKLMRAEKSMSCSWRMLTYFSSPRLSRKLTIFASGSGGGSGETSSAAQGEGTGLNVLNRRSDRVKMYLTVATGLNVIKFDRRSDRVKLFQHSYQWDIRFQKLILTFYGHILI